MAVSRHLICYGTEPAHRIVVQHQYQGQVTAPVLMNGAPWLVDGLAETTRSARFPSQSARRLVLVYSTSCPRCQVERPKWIERIPRIAVALQADVEIISLQSTGDLRPLIDALDASRRPHRELLVANPSAFTMASGVSFTPLIVLVDAGGRVRFLTSNLTDDAERALFV